MNEDYYRNQVNVIYGAPCEIIAIGHDRNLVQGAQSNPKSKRDERTDPLKNLESILEFSYGDELKNETNEKQRKRVAQGSIPVCEKKLSLLRKLLEFTGVL